MTTTAEERRLDRLEDRLMAVERTTAGTLARVRSMATTLTAVAGDLGTLLEHAAEERGARRTRRRARAGAYSLATLLFLAVGALAGRLT